MIMLDQYTITETLHQGAAVALYRAVRRRDRLPILIKALRSESPARHEVELLRHEYAIGRQLDSPYAIKPYDLERHEARLLLIVEDFGGQPLSGLLSGPCEVDWFLDIAVELAAALADIHHQGVVHKDIKPSHILIHPHTGELKLSDFGIAAPLAHVPTAAARPGLIEGSLAYISPEQTGRMNRAIDHRSDLYSLGVTFYQMLTGVLPFQASDPLEWIHCHIARQPPSPRAIVPTIPEPLAAIVLKLLAKQAEERYQSAGGLQFDLERCRAQWQAHGRIEVFPLGDHDRSDRFMIPQKMYGREGQVAALLRAFEHMVASGQPALMLVSGYSGIGKSSLVQELHQPIVRARGYFISGKFDQYQRDTPYSSITQAFRDLIQQILTESEERLQRWKAALEQALGANGQLIIDIIPQVELLIGTQPEVMELPPTEAQNRFHMVFQKFIAVFTKQEHPLVLFLDDLQWLDPASLKLIAYLITHPETRYLFLLGAYRDNEVSPSHPLMLSLDEIRKSDTLVKEIALEPLTLVHLRQLIADTVHRPAKAAAPLARLVYDKTGGNPFFAIQFLSTLYQEGLLTYDERKMHWDWDLGAIRGQGFTDNVVELMLGKLQRFSAATQEALMLAACLGNTAEATTLALICEWPEDRLHAALREAVEEGLLLRQDGSYKFLHDRVREAAYALLPEAQRPAQHLRIGRLLLANTPEQRLAENIFAIVGQLNRGAALITSREEREQLAEFNLLAGRRAKASTAYAAALTYLVAGAALLAEDAWERRHDLIFEIELHRAECEFLTGALVAAEERLNVLSTRAATTVERASVACLRVDLYTTRGQISRALAVGLEYLRHLGVEWPPHPTDEDVRREYERIWSQLGSRTIEDLIELPLMSDPASLATMDVLTKLAPPAVATDANLFVLVTCRAVNLSLERGNCDGSCFAYIWFGIETGVRFGDYQAMYRFGQLAYDLVEQRGLKRFQARTYMDFGNVVLPWKKHVRAGRDLLRRAFEAANKIGDLTYAAFCCIFLNTNLLAAGDPLPDAQREAENGLAFAQKARFGYVIDLIAPQVGLIRTLRGLTTKFGSFDDEQFDEVRIERRFSEDSDSALVEFRYRVRKLQARFFAGDYVAALEASERAQGLIWTSPSLFETAEYHFYAALSQAASCESAAAGERGQHVEALVAHHRQLEIWAENCPENFENRAALVGAEIARIESRDVDAMRLYEQAIRSARANGFIHNEALANERAARFYAARGLPRIAEMYLREARACYARWGADGKVRQLDGQYPHLIETRPLTPTTTFAVRAEQLDLLSVIKASQAISRAMMLPDVQETLMRIVLEHAGAQRGFLLLVEGERLAIHAQAESMGEQIQITVTPAIPISAATLPMSLINYVRRTGEAVVLADAAAQGPYVADEYVVYHKPRSLLCLPIVRQTQLVGMLYLENNLVAGAFTSNTLTALELLAAQAAISLDNARLYAGLQHENAGRQRVEAALQESQEYLRQIIDCIADPIFVKDQNHRFAHVNKAQCELVGVSREEMLGKLDYDFFPKEQVEIFWQQDDLVLETGVENVNEEEITDAQGNTRTIMTKKTRLTDQAGNKHIVGVIRDITARKHTEDELRTQKDILQKILDHTPMMVGTIGVDGQWQMINRAWERTFGWTLEELQQPNFNVLAEIYRDPREYQRVLDFIVAKSGKWQEFKARVRDGRMLDVTFTNVYLSDGTTLGFGLDITERKQAEEALHERASLLDLTHDTVFVRDMHDVITYWNRGAEELYGWTSKQAIGQVSHQLTRTIFPTPLEQINEELLGTGRWEGELIHTRRDGTQLVVASRWALQLDEQGNPIAILETNNNITERKRAEEELRQHRAQLEELVAERTRELSTLLETSNTIASTLELQPLLRVVLDQLKVLVRYTGAIILLLEGEDLIVLGYSGPLSAEQVSQLRLPVAQVVSYQLVRRRGGPVIVDDVQYDSPEARAYRELALADRYAAFGYARSLLLVPLIVRERLIGIVRIESSEPGFYTERDAQLALAFANQAAVAIENARLYDQARDLATIEERQRLARELHDAVTQTLFSASLIADALPDAWRQSPAKALRGVEELRLLTRGALAEMRTLLLELRPAALAEKPLGELLRSLCTAVTSRTRIPIELDVTGDVLLAPEVQIAFYRVTQEALNNIAKYAAASQVRITGRCEPNRVELRIADDGRGFEPSAVAPGSLGLGIMRERAASIGATLRVESQPGAGTAVRVEWQATPAARVQGGTA